MNDALSMEFAQYLETGNIYTLCSGCVVQNNQIQDETLFVEAVEKESQQMQIDTKTWQCKRCKVTLWNY